MTIQDHVRELKLSFRISTQRWRRKPKHVGWLVGSGRSGTTWLASLLNADASMREVFEPTHVLHVPHMKSGSMHPYVPNGAWGDPWASWQSGVFAGQFITRRTDRDNVDRNPASAESLLVKDVFACGVVGAALEAHPEVACALVMRHPIAVALSKQAHRHWRWMWSPREFLDNPELVRDHLQSWHESLAKIAHEGSELDKLVAVWAVLQRVAMCSVPQDRLPILHYEKAVLDPWKEVQSLQGQEAWNTLITCSSDQVLEAAQRRSFVSKRTNAADMPHPTRWTTKLDSASRRSAENVLDALGMIDWHHSDGMPNPLAIQEWREAHAPPRV